MTSVWLAVYIFYAIFPLGRIWKTGEKYKVKLVYEGIIFWDSGYQCSNMPPGMGYFFVNCRGIQHVQDLSHRWLGNPLAITCRDS